MRQTRWYLSEDVWPETMAEAHKFLIRAYWHLKNVETVEFETLEARTIINRLQIEVCGVYLKRPTLRE